MPKYKTKDQIMSKYSLETQMELEEERRKIQAPLKQLQEKLSKEIQRRMDLERVVYKCMENLLNGLSEEITPGIACFSLIIKQNPELISNMKMIFNER